MKSKTVSNTAAWTSGAEPPDSPVLRSSRAVPTLPEAALPETATLRVAGRMAESIVDGPGLRYVLFTQGCPHHCPGCHNPESHDFAAGFSASPREIYDDIRRNPLLRGVTFSGGEPFCHAPELTPLAAALKARGYHLMAYTGYVWDDLIRNPACAPLLSLLDVVVDGPFILAQRSLELRFRGSRNQRILDVPASLREGRATFHPLHGEVTAGGPFPASHQ